MCLCITFVADLDTAHTRLSPASTPLSFELPVLTTLPVLELFRCFYFHCRQNLSVPRCPSPAWAAVAGLWRSR